MLKLTPKQRKGLRAKIKAAIKLGPYPSPRPKGLLATLRAAAFRAGIGIGVPGLYVEKGKYDAYLFNTGKVICHANTLTELKKKLNPLLKEALPK